MVVIEDDRIVEIRPDSIALSDLEGNELELDQRTVEWDLEAAEKGGYATFMLKEIFEQPHAIVDTLAGRVVAPGRVVLDELKIENRRLREIDKVFVIACGTSYHAAMMAKYAIERWTRLPVEIDIASEFRYRDPVLDHNSLVIGISQSGETIDTLAAIRYARAQGSTVIGVSQCRRIGPGSRSRRRPLHPGRPGDRGRGHQDIHHPTGGDATARPLPGPGAGDSRPGCDRAPGQGHAASARAGREGAVAGGRRSHS